MLAIQLRSGSLDASAIKRQCQIADGSFVQHRRVNRSPGDGNQASRIGPELRQLEIVLTDRFAADPQRFNSASANVKRSRSRLFNVRTIGNQLPTAITLGRAFQSEVVSVPLSRDLG